MIYSVAAYSGFHYSFKVSIVIVAATLVSSCLSAPTCNTVSEPWWFNPCNKGIHRIRYSRSTDGAVIVTLKVFMGKLTENTGKIIRLYNHRDISGTKYPRQSWFKINKWLRDIKKSTSQSESKTLEKFYHALQHFAATIEKLRLVNIETEVNFNKSERNDIFANIGDHLRTLLCEVYDRLRKGGDVVNSCDTLKPNFAKELKSTFNYNEAHLNDIIFFKKANRFVKKLLAYKKYIRPKGRKGKKLAHQKRRNKELKKTSDIQKKKSRT